MAANMELVTLDPEIAFAQASWDARSDEERAGWLRAALALTKTRAGELARSLHLSPQTLSAWSTGKATIDWSRRMSICLALGLDQKWEPPSPAPKKKARG